MIRPAKTLFLLSTAIILSCKGNETSMVVLDTQTFAQLYVELVNSEWKKRGGTISSDTLPDSLIAHVGATREQIAATVAYYNEDLERWRDFYKEVVRLQEKQIGKSAGKSNRTAP